MVTIMSDFEMSFSSLKLGNQNIQRLAARFITKENVYNCLTCVMPGKHIRVLNVLLDKKMKA